MWHWSDIAGNLDGVSLDIESMVTPAFATLTFITKQQHKKTGNIAGEKAIF
jgi:hypothetical protein